MLFRKKKFNNRNPQKHNLTSFKPESEKTTKTFRSPLFTRIALISTLVLSFVLFPSNCTKQGKKPEKPVKQKVEEINPKPSTTLPPKRDGHYKKNYGLSEIPPDGL